MQIGSNIYTIGADPEIFVKNSEGFVSAHNLIPGDKRNPYKVARGAVQVDGMAVEYNIDPAETYQDFSDNLSTVQAILEEMIGDHEFIEDCSVVFNEEFFETVPPWAANLGCSSDFNGWTLQENVPPSNTKLMRTAGGHVHIGGFSPVKSVYEKEHFEKCARLARILDMTLGIPSLSWDSDTERRSMYGQAGAFRPKKYGMEYRTLSNKWIFNPSTVEAVFNGVEQGLTIWQNTSYEPSEKVRIAINTSNADVLEAA